MNKLLEIEVVHLPSVSHVKIDVICDICGSEKNIMYCKYIDNLNRHNFYGCKKCSRQKAALTSMDKYGVDNYSKTDEFKIRLEKTNIEKYGYKTNLISPDSIEINKKILKEKYGTENWYEIRNGNNKNKKLKLIKHFEKIKIIYSEDLYNNELVTTEYLLYRNECRRITKSNEKKLIKNWDGYDYYSNEYIFNNFDLDFNNPDYPTIDHKISIYYGFTSNISPIEIGSITNLCITKRSINSSKQSKNESDFSILKVNI